MCKQAWCDGTHRLAVLVLVSVGKIHTRNVAWEMRVKELLPSSISFLEGPLPTPRPRPRPLPLPRPRPRPRP
eukprot:2796627-Rhodomonas_salina.2